MTDHLISGRTLSDWRELSRMDHVFDLIVPSELRALVERIAELEAKLSVYENAPTIGVIRDVGSRPYCDWKVSQSTLPKSGAEIIARPTFKDKT